MTLEPFKVMPARNLDRRAHCAKHALAECNAMPDCLAVPSLVTASNNQETTVSAEQTGTNRKTRETAVSAEEHL